MMARVAVVGNRDEQTINIKYNVSGLRIFERLKPQLATERHFITFTQMMKPTPDPLTVDAALKHR